MIKPEYHKGVILSGGPSLILKNHYSFSRVSIILEICKKFAETLLPL